MVLTLTLPHMLTLILTPCPEVQRGTEQGRLYSVKTRVLLRWYLLTAVTWGQEETHSISILIFLAKILGVEDG